MSAPWLDDGDVQFYHGDAASVLRSLPAGSVQTCVTSPPYWGLRDYGTGSWSGGDADCDHVRKMARNDPDRDTRHTDGRNPATQGMVGVQDAIQFADTCGRCGAQRVDAQLGLERTPGEYVAALVAVFREVWRVLRDDGTCWINLGDSYASDAAKGGSGTPNGRNNRGEQYARPGLGGLKAKDLVGIPWRVAFALQADGWYLRSDIVWSKPNPMPESVTDRPTKAHEYVFLLAKQPRYYWDADAVREAPNLDVQAHIERYKSNPRVGSKGNPDRNDNGGAHNGGMGYNPAGRNLRTVWQIATQPTPEAHFATYPEALVERCIKAGTSERGECGECGAPWQRRVERESIRAQFADKQLAGGKNDGIPLKHETPSFSNSHGASQTTRITELGWSPSCTCGALARPQAVLDPFVGSGTTALVARRHGRRCIGIDLSVDYLAIAAKRTQQLSLLGEGAA